MRIKGRRLSFVVAHCIVGYVHSKLPLLGVSDHLVHHCIPSGFISGPCLALCHLQYIRAHYSTVIIRIV